MNKTHYVLDNGYIKLWSVLGGDQTVVDAARVSYDSFSKTKEQDSNLIKYLLTNGHTSPFEHVVFTFEVKAPIFVFRQWHRHRTWSFNEVSARYTQLSDDMYSPDPKCIGVQSKSSKQARDFVDYVSGEELEQTLAHIEAVYAHSYNAYKVLLSRGVPRELARIVLPLGTYSKMLATCDLHNLLHFLKLRLHEHAQYEIRVYAEAILDIITDLCPVTVGHWKELNNIKVNTNDKS